MTNHEAEHGTYRDRICFSNGKRRVGCADWVFERLGNRGFHPHFGKKPGILGGEEFDVILYAHKMCFESTIYAHKIC